MQPLPRLTTFRGLLRSHKPFQLNGWGQAVLQLAFPRFKAPEWTEEAKAEAIERAPPWIKKVMFQPAQFRRYAGHEFNRGRYHSVALDELGQDWNTLVGELRAYRDPTDTETFVRVWEGSQIPPGHYPDLPPKIAQVLPACIVVEVMPANRLFQLVFATTRGQIGSKDSNVFRDDVGVDVILLPHLQRVEIDNVVDLRDPQTRASFFDVFAVGQEIDVDASQVQYKRIGGGNIRRFAEMLPELLHPKLGGDATSGSGGLTQSIGDYLRSAGVAGLVYPSARTDTFVEVLNGSVTRFGGWNFVDYRGSEPLARKAFVQAGPWSLVGLDNVSIQAPDAGPYTESFKVTGQAAMNNSIYEESASQSLRRAMDADGKTSLVVWGSTTLDDLAAS